MHSLQGEALPDWENSTNRVTMNFQECLRNFAGTVEGYPKHIAVPDLLG
jgi:hypothetical protein